MTSTREYGLQVGKARSTAGNSCAYIMILFQLDMASTDSHTKCEVSSCRHYQDLLRLITCDLRARGLTCTVQLANLGKRFNPRQN
jgi:hypothetical protein